MYLLIQTYTQNSVEFKCCSIFLNRSVHRTAEGLRDLKGHAVLTLLLWAGILLLCASHQEPWSKCKPIPCKCCLIWCSSPSVYLCSSLFCLSLGSWFLEGQSFKQRLRQRKSFIPEPFPGPHLVGMGSHFP